MGAGFPQGLARTLSARDFLPRGPPLSARCDGPALPELATGSATSPPGPEEGPGVPARRSLYQVVLPASQAREGTCLLPIVGGFPEEIRC